MTYSHKAVILRNVAYSYEAVILRNMAYSYEAVILSVAKDPRILPGVPILS